MNLFSFSGVAALALLLCPALAQKRAKPLLVPVKSVAIDSVVRQEMRQQHIAGLSLDIIQHGRVVLAKGYGFANLEQAAAASPHSVYKIGSVSKQMVAAAVLLLVQAHRLALTDTLPQFFKGAPAAWSKITVRHLLNHTSGLPRDSPALD